MANKLDEYIAYLESQVDKGLYVLGGQTQVIKTNLVYKDDTMLKCLGSLKQWMSGIGQNDNYASVNKLYQQRIKKWGDVSFRIMDCSGLGMNWLYNMKHIADGDMTANGMMGKCERLEKAQLKKGDWFFRTYKSGSKKGKAHHVGYVVDDSLNVIEDKGRAYGVVKKPMDSTYWNTYGRPSYFKAEIEAEKEEPKETGVFFARVIKRVTPTMTGADVMELQRLLNKANGANLAVDGKCGPATEKAIKAYQKIKGLTVDGKAGKKTITALGGEWVG